MNASSRAAVRSLFNLLWLLPALWVLAANVAAQPVKVSGNASAGQGVISAALSPDGKFLVFTATRGPNNRLQLYTANMATGAITTLVPVPRSETIDTFSISADGRYVLFLTIDNTELYSVPMTGGTPVKLSGSGVANTEVGGWVLTPDGSDVILYGNLRNTARRELFRVPVAGGPLAVLSEPMVSGGGVSGSLRFTADGQRLIFRGDLDQAGVDEWYVLNLSSGARAKLSGAIAAGGALSNRFALSPNGEYAVFSGDLTTPGEVEVYSVSLATLNRVALSGSVVSSGSIDNFAISPDSQRVVFSGRVNSETVARLFSVPIAGGTRVTLSGTNVANGDVRNDFLITSDSTRVVFSGDLVTNNLIELFSAPIDQAGGRVLISGATTTTANPAGANEGIAGFVVTPDGQRVVFRGNLAAQTRIDLFSVDVDGGTRTRISGTGIVAGGNVGRFQLTKDGTRVLFRGDLDVDDQTELYVVPVTGTTPLNLSGPLVSGGSVSAAFVDGVESRVYFLADKLVAGVNEVFRVQIGGSALALDIDGDDQVLAETDLTMLLRYRMGFRDTLATAGALGPLATTSNLTTLQNRLTAALALDLNLDDDSGTFAHTDLLMLLRYQLDQRGAALVNDARAVTPVTATTIASRIRALLATPR